MDISARIIRIARGDDGTFGTLVLNDQPYCVTLELPWRGNAPNISCIPTGRYVAKRTPSLLVAKLTKNVWPSAFEITGVPGRSRVLIHPGNTAADTQGCILVAQYYGKLRGDRAVLNSGATFNDFMTVTRTVQQFPITIIEAI